jgi:aminoglycoside 3-N-acetyltransferase
MLPKEAFDDFIRRNRLAGQVICLHASFKSFGPVAGGPQALIDAFLAADCTLLCPAFFYKSESYPPGANYAQNGVDYGAMDPLPAVNYVDSAEQIEAAMGIIPRTILTYPAAQRTPNPLNSFTALGRQADFLLRGHHLLNVYSAYKQIYNNNLPACVLLAGVDFTACTPIHFAEEVAGKRLFRRWAVYHGRTVEVEVGSCSDGFENLADATRSIERVAYLGQSRLRLYPFNPFIERIAAALRAEPALTSCRDKGCLRCQDMACGGRRSAAAAALNKGDSHF